jgi:biotin carboxyl carrier protein
VSPQDAAPTPVEHGAEAHPPADTSIILSSEMVGHFHHANPPIRVGSTIKEGQVVGNVESMKLMNEVVAESAGQVVEVLIEDGEPVDYGRQLFRIVPK